MPMQSFSPVSEANKYHQGEKCFCVSPLLYLATEDVEQKSGYANIEVAWL